MIDPQPTSGPPASIISDRNPAGVSSGGRQDDPAIQRVPRHLIWLHRITVLLFVLLCASAGVLLMIVPWRPEWTDNALIAGSPRLQAFFGSGFVRGVCSGLGILDIWIGFWEAVHYHEPKQL